MEYIIYCDESVGKGKYYSNFFGGALVQSQDFEQIKQSLDEKKRALNVTGEMKWIKVTSSYLIKYVEIMDTFFSFVRDKKIKVRIMFQRNDQMPSHLGKEQIENRYYLLYYQLVKHAFGLVHRNTEASAPVYLRLYFDEIPFPLYQREVFKSHIFSLQRSAKFRKAGILIRRDDIAEINSKKHSVQQCVDVILGSISFMLNKKNLEMPEGATERGSRTIAKEKLFQHILELIKDSNGVEFFDISTSTPIMSLDDLWTAPYLHWKLIPSEYLPKRKSPTCATSTTLVGTRAFAQEQDFLVQR